MIGQSGQPTASVPQILVVDDDERNLFAVRQALEGIDADVVLARSGGEALKRLLQADFAVILLDIHMPGMDGYATAEMIRMREKSRHIPIIFLTAINKDAVQVFQGYAAGAVDYLFKPVDPMILRSKVSVFVELYRKAEEIKREAEIRQHLLAENLRARTEKLVAEQALRRAEERQSLILQAHPIILYSARLAAPDTPFYVSANAEEVLGYPAHRLEDEPGLWLAAIPPEDRDHVLERRRSVVSAGATMIEYRWRQPDGRQRVLLEQVSLARSDEGQPAEIVGTVLDVTEMREVQSQLAHAHKMETIGQLTGGIAHDFNNMLMVVIGSLDRISRMTAEQPALAKRVDLARQAALRCSDMTRQLLAFARKRQLHPEPVALDLLVVGMAELLERTLGNRIEISIEKASAPWAAIVDRAQAEAAVLNLVINARDAMPEGGRLTIRTANVTFDEPQSSYGVEVPPGDYVELSIADSGQGMAPDVIERIFEPFFTTKEIGRGTGLGLSMTYGFVKQSGGMIRVESSPGQGSIFRLYLPRAAEEGREASQDALEDGPVVGGNEVVLVVDDDKDVRHVAAMTLQDLGYHVIEAENGAQALGVLRTDRRIDLLFTDIVMPGSLSGRDLARRGLSLRPGLKILFASGYANGTSSADSDVVMGETLTKPYRDSDLARAVRRALDTAMAACQAPAGPDMHAGELP